MIESKSNNKVKRLAALSQRAKFRREEGVFIAEGVKLFLEAPKQWIREVYISETFLCKYKKENNTQVKEALDAAGCEVLSDEAFKKASDTQTPQGVLCVLAMPHYELQASLEGWLDKDKNTGAPLLLLLEDLQDPGNLGTILRTSEGAGVSGVIMTRHTTDLFNPKVIRSTMGSIYRVPFFITEGLDSTIELLKSKGVAVYAAHLEGSAVYDEQDYTEPSAIIIGNESSGLKRGTADKATRCIRIPMAGQVESLNAAMSAAVLMYEAARQRRKELA